MIALLASAAATSGCLITDPVLPVDVHEDVARGFLHAMTIDRTDGAARKDASAITAPIDDSVMTAILERLCPSMSEIYGFRIHDAAFLLEVQGDGPDVCGLARRD